MTDDELREFREFLLSTLGNPRADDDWTAISDRLDGNPAELLGELIPRAVFDPSDPDLPRPDPASLAALRRATDVLVRLSADAATPMSPQDTADLVLLAHIAGRPALAVRNGDYVTPPSQWSFLNPERIQPRLPSVGRIDAPAGTQRGTGFVVKRGVVMTNRHVAELLMAHGAGAFPTDAVIDFLRDLDGTSKTARMVKAIWISDIDEVDLALLEVEDTDLPAPLRILTRAPEPLEKRLVYAIGYPGADNQGTTPADVMGWVFRDALGIKRVQPGLVRALDPADPRRFRHDCSTLGGSSGSCIVDYATGLVCGLHYSGVYKKRNSAVALWAVADHAEIAPYITVG